MMHKRHTKVTRSQEQEVRDMLERRKGVPAIVRETGISRTKIYDVKRELETPRKSPQEVAKEWFEALPNRAECVLAVGSYIAQVQVATGKAPLDPMIQDWQLRYRQMELMVIYSISDHDLEVASAVEGFAQATEEVRTTGTETIRDGLMTIPAGYGWVRTVDGMVSKEVQAKANELIEVLKPYTTL